MPTCYWLHSESKIEPNPVQSEGVQNKVVLNSDENSSTQVSQSEAAPQASESK